MIEMINSKELDFQHELGNINERTESMVESDDEELPAFFDNKDSGKTAGDQVVFEVDAETLAQNVQAPYLFVTFRPYADRNQILKGDLSQLTQDNQSHAPFMQLQGSEAANQNDRQKLRNQRMVAISFAATNFPMENLIQVDEHMAFDGDGPEEDPR